MRIVDGLAVNITVHERWTGIAEGATTNGRQLCETTLADHPCNKRLLVGSCGKSGLRYADTNV